MIGSKPRFFAHVTAALATTALATTTASAVDGLLGLPDSVPAYGQRMGLDFQRGYVSLNLLDEADWLEAGPALADANLWSATFVDNDFSRQFALGEANVLRAIDTQDGSVTDIGDVAPTTPGEYWIGLSWNPADGQLYAAGCNHTPGEGCHLYTIDAQTAALAEIGYIGGSDHADFFLLDMAFDSKGRLYAINTTDAYPTYLIRIDPPTARVTPIGPTGLVVMYAQGIDFDKRTDTLYWTAFGALGDGGAFQGKVYTVDTDTGAVTNIGLTPGGGEIWALSIATAAGTVGDGVFCDGFDDGGDGTCD